MLSLFTDPKTVTQDNRGRTRIVFTVRGAFLNIQETIVTPEFNKKIILSECIIQTDIPFNPKIGCIQVEISI